MNEMRVYPKTKFLFIVGIIELIIVVALLRMTKQNSSFERWGLIIATLIAIPFFPIELLTSLFLDERGIAFGYFWKGRLLKETKRINYNEIKRVSFSSCHVTVFSNSDSTWDRLRFRHLVDIPLSTTKNWRDLLVQLLIKVPREKIDNRIPGLLSGTTLAARPKPFNRTISRYDAACKYYWNGKYEKVVTTLRKVLKIKPSRFYDGRINAYVLLAESYRILEKYDQAYAVAQDAEIFAPDNPVAHHELGITGGDIGATKEAAEHFRKAKKGYLEIGDTESAEFCDKLTEILPFKHDPMMLLQYCQQKLNEYPSNEFFMYHMAKAFEQMKRWDDAKMVYLEVKKINSANHRLADLYLKRLSQKSNNMA